MTTITEISQDQLDKVAAELSPDVVYIRASVDTDWDGDPAIHFRVVLPDGFERSRLGDVIDRIGAAVEKEFRPIENGRWPFYSYRTVADQKKFNDPDWQ